MMPRSSAKIPGVWLLLALASFALKLAMGYWAGRSNSSGMGLMGFPGELFPLLLLLMSVVALASCWLWAVVKRRAAGRVGGMFLLAGGLFVASGVLRPDGFPQYARTVLTAEEWRSIARWAQARLGPDGRLPGPEKNLWEEKEHRALWSELCLATPIQKLDPSFMIFVHPDSTEIAWGGALTGHSSVIVFNEGWKRDVESGRNRKAVFIAEDIMTVVGPD